MAFVGLRLAPETARLLATIDYGDVGEPEPSNAYHVTLLNLGHEIEVEQIAMAVEPLLAVAGETKPFTARVDRVSSFPPHPEHGTVPVICPVESDGLRLLHARLSAAFEAAGVSFSKKFKDFNPHVTLAYIEPNGKPVAFKDVPFTPVEWGVHEIVLWGGDDADDRVVMTIPLSLGSRGQGAANQKKAAFEAFVRIAMIRDASSGVGSDAKVPSKKAGSIEVGGADPLRPKRLSIVEKVLLRYATKRVEGGLTEPTDPVLWKRASEESRKRFKKHQAAYAEGWALQWYNREGGEWRKK